LSHGIIFVRSIESIEKWGSKDKADERDGGDKGDERDKGDKGDKQE